MDAKYQEVWDQYASEVEMPIYGTARAYEDIYGPDDDRMNSYPLMRDRSRGSSEADTSEV